MVWWGRPIIPASAGRGKGNCFKSQDSVSLEAGRIRERERKERGRRKVWSENRKENIKTGQTLKFSVAATSMTMKTGKDGRK